MNTENGKNEKFKYSMRILKSLNDNLSLRQHYVPKARKRQFMKSRINRMRMPPDMFD